jgi:4-amino-4-deoxy-L-arabinose transferase-like glycosyltransferase
MEPVRARWRPGWRQAGAALLFTAAALLPRLFGLGDFVTVDEATWLMRSGNFYYALAQRNFAGTITAYHPAVTTTWMGALGTLIEFDDYRGQGQGYFIKETKYAEFLSEHDVHPLEILRTSRLLVVIVNTGLLLAVTGLLARMHGPAPAAVVFLILGFDPFLLGHTRIMAHEGMLSLLVVLSLVCALRYVFHGAGRADLLVSAAAAALAMLTKSTATVLVPAIGLLLVLPQLRTRLRAPDRPAAAPDLRRTLGDLTLWVGAAAAVYFIAWPAMWTAPGAALAEVYGNAFSYAIEGHQSGLAEPSLYTEFDLDASGVDRYVDSMRWHTTPLVWAGAGLAIAALVGGFGGTADAPLRRTLLVFLLFAAGFVGLMSAAGGRRSAHYILSAYAALDVAAALGLVLAWCALRSRIRSGRIAAVAAVLGGLLLVLHVAGAAAYHPYYFNYANPIMARVVGLEQYETGYGEALEAAAAYLGEKPDAGQLTAMSWYGIGPFSYFFPGTTELLAPGTAWTLSQVERLEQSDYLVLYYHHQLRRDMPASLLWRLADAPVEHAVWRNGIEYVRIYRVADLPESVWLPDPAAPITP